jgi:shikimate dehydrogenase
MRLALIGKDIQHSLSSAIYQKLLKNLQAYDLLDCKTAGEIPSLPDLFKTYRGINVTAPYKKHFVSQISVRDDENYGAVNCLRQRHGIYEGINTDAMAIKVLLPQIIPLNDLYVILLGDGVMSNVTQIILKTMGIPYQVLSRKNYQNLSSMDFIPIIDQITEHKILIINACSRDYCYRGILPAGIVFWDYNYFHMHKNFIPQQVKKYIDGTALLQLQAQFAVTFWFSEKISD